jgi:hypothetical protein
MENTLTPFMLGLIRDFDLRFNGAKIEVPLSSQRLNVFRCPTRSPGAPLEGEQNFVAGLRGDKLSQFELSGAD